MSLALTTAPVGGGVIPKDEKMAVLKGFSMNCFGHWDYGVEK